MSYMKETVRLTREEAENKYVELIMKYGNPEYWVRRGVKYFDNEELCSQLEEIHKPDWGMSFEYYEVSEEDN